MKKGLVIILDGLGDRPHPDLDGRTPLEAAKTPFFDQLVQNGMVGMVDPWMPGLPVGTQVGAGLLLGVAPPQVTSLARGVVEAHGVGAELKHGSVAMRCNYATVREGDGELEILDRRAGRIREGTDELAKAINQIQLSQGLELKFYPATQHRAVLILSGPGLSHRISGTDPGKMSDHAIVRESQALIPEAQLTAEAVNEFTRKAHQVLSDHPVNKKREKLGLLPANALLCRGAGLEKQIEGLLPNLGLKASLVTGERTLIGLGKLLGFEICTSSRFTSLPDTDLDAKVETTLEALNRSDIVFLHIKAPDIHAHDKDPKGKRDTMEKIDTALNRLSGKDIVIAVTGDHSTSCLSGNHTGDPVPSLIYNLSGRRDTCHTYGEMSCMQGGLGRLTAYHFLLNVLDSMEAVSQSQRVRRQIQHAFRM